MQKLSHLLSCVCILLSTTFAWSQDVSDLKITFTIKDGNILDCIRSIEEQTDYTFVFSNSIDLNKKITVSFKKDPLMTILNEIFRKNSIDYEISGKQIVLKNIVDKVQSRTISGVVIDGGSIPLAGAMVYNLNTSGWTTTDGDGRFSIDVEGNDDILSFTYLGFQSKEMPVKARNNLVVELIQDLQAIEETIIIGYGSKNKNKIVGAVNQVNKEAFANKPVTNLGQALQGAIPNLNITVSDGKLNRNPEYNIRGFNSINGGSPLVLVDGVPGDLNMISPEDIESVSVLKDASSAAIYGAQASFGVILVTTKMGETEKPRFRYTTNVGFSQPLKTPELLMDGEEYARIMQESYKGWTGSEHAPLNDVISYLQAYKQNPDMPIGYVNDIYMSYISGELTDWYKTIYNDYQPFHRHHLEVSGAGNRLKYYISGGYSYQDGVYRISTDNLSKVNTKAKLEVNVTKNIKLFNNFSFEEKTYDSPNTTVYGSWDILRFMTQLCSPFSTIYDNEGNYTYGGLCSVGVLQDSGRSVTKKMAIRETVGAEISFLKGDLKLKGDFSIWQDRAYGNEQRIRLSYSSAPGSVAPMSSMPDYFKRAYSEGKLYTINAYLDYNKTIKKHTVAAILGFNQSEDYYSTFNANINDNLMSGYGSLNLADGDVTVGDDEYEWATRGFFYRLSYDYASRYLVELNGRFDGTSRFPSHNRWGFFPSAAVGWVLSNEKFMSFLKPAVDVLKIRASYGSLGNQQVSAFSYMSTMSKKQLGGYLTDVNNPHFVDYTTVPGLVAGDLTWETVVSKNIGLDLDMFKRRFSVGVDFYERVTKDMLASGVSLPSVLGAKVPKTNSADLSVKGWEASVMWRDQFTLFGKSGSYSLKFVISDNRAVITKYGANDGKLISGYNVGEEIGTIWGLECLGFFQSKEEIAGWADQSKVTTNIKQLMPGDLKFKDQNADNVIDKGQETLNDPGDLVRIGNTSSRFPYSFDINLSWNNFDLNVFFQGVGKRDFYPGTESALMWGTYNRWYNPIWKHIAGNYWTEDNPDAYFPRLRGYMANNATNELGIPNTRYLQDASYLRLKTLTFGYTIPQHITRKVKIDKVRFFFSGHNLLTFTKLFECFDPEAISNLNGNGAGFVYPIQRTFTFGLDINF